MAKKIFEWLFYLIENHLTPEEGDYFAKIRSQKTKTIDDIADRIVKERTEFRKETIVNIISLVNDAKIEFLSQGNSVNDGITIYEPAITGVFDGETNYDEKKNKCVVNTHSTKEVRTMLENVRPSYSGLTVDNGGAVIEKVVDSFTASVNEFITPGKAITITGKKIRIVLDEDVPLEEGVIFTKEDTKEEFYLDTPIIMNDPSKVVIQVPDLSRGTYRLTFKTLYSSTSATLKAPRYITFKMKLSVI